MNKKKILVIIGLFFAFFILFLMIKNHVVNFFNKQDSNIELGLNKSTVKCSMLEARDIVPYIEISGRVNSVNRINIVSEVNGVSEFNNSRFEVGEFFNSGEIILSINNSDLDLELKSKKSQFLTILIQVLPEIKMDFPNMGKKIQNYINNFNLNREIPTLPGINESKQIRNYLSSKQILSTYFSIKSLEKKVDKFKIKAPFDGILTNTLIDEGSSVIIGQPLGEFINLSKYEIASSVSVQESKLISIGDNVEIYSDDTQYKMEGSISRIGESINPLTQSIDVFINILDGDVKDGMFVSGNIICDTLQDINIIARSQVVNNNSIYISKNDTIRIKNINIIVSQNDSLIVNGIDQKDCVVNLNRKYYYDGMPIN